MARNGLQGYLQHVGENVIHDGCWLTANEVHYERLFNFNQELVQHARDQVIFMVSLIQLCFIHVQTLSSVDTVLPQVSYLLCFIVWGLRINSQ